MIYVIYGGWRGEISEQNSCQNATDIQKIGAVWMGVMADLCSHFVKSKTASFKCHREDRDDREARFSLRKALALKQFA